MGDTNKDSEMNIIKILVEMEEWKKMENFNTHLNICEKSDRHFGTKKYNM